MPSFSCGRPGAALALVLAGCAPSLESIKKHAMIHSAEVVELRGDGRNSVLVAPRLQGRVLTCRVGAVESVGYVRQDRIEALDLDKQFNNYGGLDRLWLGPEAGRFGLYFEPGSPAADRKAWRVPSELNSGAMSVLEQDERHLRMSRELELVNYSGTRFKVRVDREVGLVPAQKLNEELGLPLPPGVEYIGCYSLNTLTQLGPAAMERDKGLLCLWVLGMLNASPQALVIAPLRKDDPAAGTDLGPKFNDDYFGRVSQETPERLKLIDDAVIFRADAQREGKFGLSPQRAIGLAGSFDAAKQLLVIIKFDLHPEEPLHASFSWRADEPNPWGGDVFQSYNADASKPESRQSSFYELESVSPCKELKTGESLIHRHATFCFQGDRQRLNEIARTVLNVDLETAVREMLGS